MSTVLILISGAWPALAAFTLAICRASARSDARETQSQPGSRSPTLSTSYAVEQTNELGRRRPPPSRRPRTARGFLLPVALPEARGHPPMSPRLIFRNDCDTEPRA